MSRVVSKDGTEIAYDREGSGAAVVLVDGALGTRSTSTKPELVRLLAQRFTAYSYDRRGRGESGDTGPYAVAREVEDIEALIMEAGGTAFVYGHSSGAALGLEAALALGRKVRALAMYEAPYNDDEAAQQSRKKYVIELEALLAEGRREDAVLLFLEHLQIPAQQVEMMRGLPLWGEFMAAAPTLAYDAAVLGETGRVPVERAALLEPPALVMNGGASYPFMAETAQTLSKIMPQAHLHVLEGQTHGANPTVLAPVLAQFFSAHG
ncbi:alpha/beta fold hydrolase [Tunturiibacter gelidoferens]|uniref:Pimeloyl-ACP methyl ester carboxylesterase n=1 Tax=Tunturiibacter gelidiferens TaxID=3069689 RepID=A0A9X0U666_9BACT|nr:alpha/beta fold hydrolase [Edaphobacter lichenicola]MBB5331266.1 pimeloyl-ACP methyl ester carboxylesterase [Edaphobacter lichenicola]